MRGGYAGADTVEHPHRITNAQKLWTDGCSLQCVVPVMPLRVSNTYIYIYV